VRGHSRVQLVAQVSGCVWRPSRTSAGCREVLRLGCRQNRTGWPRPRRHPVAQASRSCLWTQCRSSLKSFKAELQVLLGTASDAVSCNASWSTSSANSHHLSRKCPVKPRHWLDTCLGISLCRVSSSTDAWITVVEWWTPWRTQLVRDTLLPASSSSLLSPTAPRTTGNV